MSWKAIGQSVKGTSHIAVGKGCEDAIRYNVATDENGNEILLCCASDGAGSARYAAWASGYVCDKMMTGLAYLAANDGQADEVAIYTIAEGIYEGLKREAERNNAAIEEYSCTLLGCYITKDRAAFWQVGDGAIVRDDGNGFYAPVWWPQNGEYQNSTSFLIDDRTLSSLHIMVLEERVDEVGLFTDGLQMLALNMEGGNVHQPFFTGLFKYLRMADDAEKTGVLDRKLGEYLAGEQINARTDDDKTLFLATRIKSNVKSENQKINSR